MGSNTTEGNQIALNNANKAFNQYNQDYGNWSGQYNQYRQQADQRFSQDFGANAADFANKANQHGIQAANQQVAAHAAGATNQAQLASRQAGLSKGQAAMNAAGAANQAYQNNFANAVQQGQNLYQNSAQMGQDNLQQRKGNSMGLMGQANQGIQGAMGTQAQVGLQQVSDFDRNMGITGAVGGAVTGIAGAVTSDGNAKQNIEPTDWQSGFMERLMALSDERIKEPIPEENDPLAEVAQLMNNYTYHYKPGVGEDPSVEHSGPIAQELLQVDGYRSTVVEDPRTGLLGVDTARLPLVNTGMIIDISKRLLMLEEFIKAVMGGLEGQGQPMPDVE
jgi:hypothetical protein